MTNKTTEALAIEALEMIAGERVCIDNLMSDKDIARQTLTAIREALAEPEITTPDVCGEVCARAKLCYGCGKALDEANAGHIPDATKMVAEHKCGGCAKTAADGWALYCVECWEKAEPVKREHTEQYWLHEINNARADGYERGYMAAKKLYAEPVKQEPVAYTNKEQLEYLKDPRYSNMPMAMWSKPFFESMNVELYAAPVQPVKQEPVAWTRKRFGEDREYCEEPFTTDWTPLYAAPVDAKAIRAEALEEAAKWFESSGANMMTKAEFAAAIRGLK